MNQRILSSISCALVLTFACTNVPKADTDFKEVVQREPSVLDATFNAHGGLDLWDKMNTLSFNIGGEQGEDFLLDLKQRYERIEGQGYTIGYDGEEYWSDVRDTAVGKKNAKFLINLQFYFFAMPFVLADEGVHLEVLPDRSIGDKTYRVVRASFGDGVGVAPEDQYIVYFDPTSGRMEYLLYSVTYFKAENRDRFNALHYHTWQNIDGLLLPKQATRYNWDNENNALGTAKGEKTFANVKVSAQVPDAEQFQKK